MAAAPDAGEAAVGARGLTGPGVPRSRVLGRRRLRAPFLAAIRPAAARAMLEYRIRRLPAARAAAAAAGRRGARFPWESAATGRDVTPRSVRGRNGELVPIRTGAARRAHRRRRRVGGVRLRRLDRRRRVPARAPAATLIVETARYWAQPGRGIDGDGRGHLYGVIGPDEYHELVDDNAYTNVMARWNLRAPPTRGRPPWRRRPPRPRRWRRLGGTLVDGYDPATGVYEQFAGFFGLEPLLIADVAPPPGRRRPPARSASGSPARRSSSRPTSSMLHHLVPDEVAPGSLGPNLAYYEPRTAHGSSLSPAIHAALLARAGQPDAGARAVPPRGPPRPRRPHRHRRGRPAPGDDGGRVAGARLRVPRAAPAAPVARRRPVSAWRLGRPSALGSGSAVTASGCGPDHDTVSVSCTRPLRVRIAGAAARACRAARRQLPLQGATV